MDEILTHVRSSLKSPAPATNVVPNANATDAAIVYVEEQWDTYVDVDADGDVDADTVANEIVFDDTGEGAGVEGDLDMDDD
jgi:hypothetical protein